jgi:putative transposase
MLLVLKLMLWSVRSLTRSRRVVVLENLALRQQLAIAVRSGRRPKLVAVDRAFWIALRQVWTDWSASLAIVKPATVVAWHRRAYRTYWRHLCRKPGRPRTDEEPRELIARMVKENRWGAPRIHGELLKLGFRVSERTVSRYVRALRPRRPAGTSWMTFLTNHRDVLAAMDFFTVPTVTFRLLYVLLVIQHCRRKVLHVNVTPHPTFVPRQYSIRRALEPKIAGSLLTTRARTYVRLQAERSGRIFLRCFSFSSSPSGGFAPSRALDKR